MGKYFGTDGFRGEAGITLTADHAYKVGRFLGWYYNALREREQLLANYADVPENLIATIHGIDWRRAKWGGFASKYIKFGEKVAVKFADEIMPLTANIP